MLEELGFTEAEERLYMALLTRPDAAAEAFGGNAGQARALLDG